LVVGTAATTRFQAEAGVEAAAATRFQAEAGVEAAAAIFEVASRVEAGVAGVEEPGAAAEVKDEARQGRSTCRGRACWWGGGK
jgi:hypothetical protein